MTAIAAQDDKVETWRENARNYFKLNMHRLDYRLTSVSGTFCCELRVPDYPMPVGNVWFRTCGPKIIELIYSFVHHDLRRLGIRTIIHEGMRQFYSKYTFFTGKGTEDGTAWLEAAGFMKNDDGWSLRPEKIVIRSD